MYFPIFDVLQNLAAWLGLCVCLSICSSHCKLLQITFVVIWEGSRRLDKPCGIGWFQLAYKSVQDGVALTTTSVWQIGTEFYEEEPNKKWQGAAWLVILQSELHNVKCVKQFKKFITTSKFDKQNYTKVHELNQTCFKGQVFIFLSF